MLKSGQDRAGPEREYKVEASPRTALRARFLFLFSRALSRDSSRFSDFSPPDVEASAIGDRGSCEDPKGILLNARL